MRLAQPARMSTSTSETATRVLPVPVAWTKSALRKPDENRTPTRLTASSWYMRSAMVSSSGTLTSSLRCARWWIR
jgi:hypothetical protein